MGTHREIGEPTIDPLIRAMDSQNEYMRSYAGIALARINETRALAPLIHALEDNDSDVQYAANDSLKKLGWH